LVVRQEFAELNHARDRRVSDQFRFILRSVEAFEACSVGESARAQEIAHELDQLSGGGFELAKFLETATAAMG